VNPGDCVVTSIDTSFRIDEYVSKKGGHTRRVMLGNLHEGITQYSAVFAGEPWKHIHVKFGMWIDGIVSTAFLAKFIVHTEASQVCSDIHEYPLQKINIKTDDRASMVNFFRNKVNNFPDIKDVTIISGIRINFCDGSWILVRPSGTEPKIRIIIEGVTQQKFELLSEFVHQTLDESKSLYSIVN
jgi:phosphomannomutase